MEKIHKLLSFILVFIGISAFDIKGAAKQTESKIKKTEALSAERKTEIDKLLLEAVRKNNIKQVQEALEQGADVNALVFVHGAFETPLIRASFNGYIDIVKLLLENEANVNAKDKFGQTALMVASGSGHDEIVNLLLKYEADVNAKDEYDNTALMKAYNIESARLLLEHKADVNAKTKDGITALMEASRFSSPSHVELLLKHNADINARDKSGHTALALAFIKHKYEIVKLLLENGAIVDDQSLKFIEGRPKLRKIYEEFLAARERIQSSKQ